MARALGPRRIVTPASQPATALTELLAVVTGADDQVTVCRRAVEQVALAFAAEAALTVGDDVVFSPGFAAGGPVSQALLDVSLDLAGGVAGRPEQVRLLRLDREDGLQLAVARLDEEWSAADAELLRDLSHVLRLGLDTRRLVANERRQREAIQRQADATAGLVATLREQQALLQRLAGIQRSISARQPLQQVLDAIVAGTAELLGEDVVGLRLLDPDDPTQLVLVSSTGVPEHLVAASRRQPLASGIGGQALIENRLVHADSYGELAQPLAGFAADGVRSAMGAPVRQGELAVGSLVVASRRPRRPYSSSEQEALTAFAEHVGLALNDAQSVEALHRAVDEATQTSLHDSLTSLPNRVLFLTRLQDVLRQPGGTVSVLFLDIDDFKVVNDSLGHLVGDQLLTAVAQRILDEVRTPDTVARLSGDEFAVLLPRAGPDSAAQAAVRVLASLRRPFHLPGHSVHVGASIGIATARGGDVQADGLLRDADVAMYRAKAEGKHRYVVFEKQMRDRLLARTALEAELRRAVEDGHFTVHYQPIVEASTGRMLSTEALVRWEHPERGLIPPGEFIPLAEDTGLIVPIGAFTLEQACRQTQLWRADPDLADLGVSVNLSPRQLQEPDLVETVAAALLGSGLPASALVLEITESLLVRDVDQANSMLDELARLGVRLAVDDFGTGYSCLAYLGALPVHLLKVDRRFVADLADPGGAGRLASAVLAIASSLDLETVAEGVETVEQAAALVDLGCSRQQGFLYSRPVPPALLPDITRALARRPVRSVPSARSSLA